MISLLDLEGIPSGMGSGSCNGGRTELPDLGIDIGNDRNPFGKDTICAQIQADLVANGDDWNVVFGRRANAGSSKSILSHRFH